MTEFLYRHVFDIFSIKKSTPFLPSITTHAAVLYLAFSQSASHWTPLSVVLSSINDILAGVFSGQTAPHNATAEPSDENLIPYAVFPSGFIRLDAHDVHFSYQWHNHDHYLLVTTNQTFSRKSIRTHLLQLSFNARCLHPVFPSARISQSPSASVRNIANFRNREFCPSSCLFSPSSVFSLSLRNTSPVQFSSGGVPR